MFKVVGNEEEKEVPCNEVGEGILSKLPCILSRLKS